MSSSTLVGASGLRVVRLWHDSGDFQFTASELYRKGIRVIDAQGRVTPFDQHFTAEQLRRFEQDSGDLNLADRGDQVVVLLQRNDQ